ncbi:alpha/beta fold hydrolase [Bradyrhizobium jicamae]|uniref:alpha/beta fold hydrolase n=1 Tax=Bradyrhizobium jicamae TaxID=280332 RepID=UPI001BAB9D16|nr:alpha/beta fold hydrolase [Bradyrhizobium jicamae]MBR0751410.1 alpha/beta fold hydrolase [Bradyrhizobium jicamae]
MRVQHRHIIYIQGYDPRGLAQYYRMFRTELRKFGRLYQVNATISRPKVAADDEIASWTVDTRADDWQTHTAYDFLRFEDFIQRDLASPIWRTVLHAVWIYLRLIVSGTIARFAKANWRFATFISYPHIVLLLEAMLVAAVAFVFEKGLTAIGIPAPISIATAVAIFIALLGVMLKYTENSTYVLYLLADTIWTWEFSHRERPEWDRRIDRFAQHLVNVARTTDADEIVIVGHSSGSFLGTELLARALLLDPALGERGPRVVLLTIGGNFPIVGYHSVSRDFREHLRQLAIAPSIDWIDCQARKDVMNFFQFDPILSHGIDVGAARRNPRIVAVRFRDLVREEDYDSFRWQFFRVHFQFVMANDRPAPYDFFMIVCGPVPVTDRMAHPDAALAIASGDKAARERAWAEIESAAGNHVHASQMGGMEPSARSMR